MIIENILDMCPPSGRPTLYRSASGAEIDLIIEFGTRERWAIEIKRSISNPGPSKGFYIGCEDIKATRQFVLYPGTERFKFDPKREVMPLQTFLKDLLMEQAR